MSGNTVKIKMAYPWPVLARFKPFCLFGSDLFGLEGDGSRSGIFVPKFDFAKEVKTV